MGCTIFNRHESTSESGTCCGRCEHSVDSSRDHARTSRSVSYYYYLRDLYSAFLNAEKVLGQWSEVSLLLPIGTGSAAEAISHSSNTATAATRLTVNRALGVYS